MPAHQANFRAHLEKLNFRFTTKHLDMPAKTASDDLNLDK